MIFCSYIGYKRYLGMIILSSASGIKDDNICNIQQTVERQKISQQKKLRFLQIADNPIIY